MSCDLQSDEMIIIALYLYTNPFLHIMLSEFSFSTPRSGKRHQDSILNEYRRLNMDQQSFYFSIEPIAYSPLPKFLPYTISKNYSHCIYLENSTFYQMFTFAIFQHLFKITPQRREKKINKLKELICSNNFLNFANFTKGLILKGLKIMTQNSLITNHPIAEILMGSQKLPAFCQCWKEMLYYFKSKQQEVSDINSSMIEVFTLFFQVDIRFYTKKGKQFLEEIVRGQGQNSPYQNEADHIAILLISNSFDDEQASSKQQSISSISSIYGNWSYYILLPFLNKQLQKQEEIDLPLTKKINNKFRGIRRATITIDYPELFSIDQEKSQIKSKIHQEGNQCQIIVRNAKGVVEKGYGLVEKMKKFTESLMVVN